MKKIIGILILMFLSLQGCVSENWERLSQTERGVWERCLGAVRVAQCPASPYQGGMLPDVNQNICISQIGETFASLPTDLQRREYLQSVGCPPGIAMR